MEWYGIYSCGGSNFSFRTCGFYRREKDVFCFNRPSTTFWYEVQSILVVYVLYITLPEACSWTKALIFVCAFLTLQQKDPTTKAIKCKVDKRIRKGFCHIVFPSRCEYSWSVSIKSQKKSLTFHMMTASVWILVPRSVLYLQRTTAWIFHHPITKPFSTSAH